MASAQKQNQSQFRELVFVIEKFFFRYITICDSDPDNVGKVFGKFANKILLGTFVMNDFKEELKTLIKDDANDEKFKSQLRLKLVYQETGKIKQIIRYFLIYIEHHRKIIDPTLSKGGRKVIKTPVHIVARSSSVEHIYPQNPITYDIDISEDKSRGDLTNCLGNLTFLSSTDNSSMGNVDYGAKKLLFKDSVIWLNQQIAQKYSNWTANAIIEHENWLIEMALKIFKL